MVSFADLCDAQPGLLAGAAVAWAQLAADLARLEDRTVDEVTGPMRNSGWAGPAADAAFAVFDLLDDEFELAALQVRNLAAVMRKAAEEFDGVHKQFLAVVDAATVEHGFRVDGHGRVYAPPPTEAERHDPDGQLVYRRKKTTPRSMKTASARLTRLSLQLLTFRIS